MQHHRNETQSLRSKNRPEKIMQDGVWAIQERRAAATGCIKSTLMQWHD